MWAVFNIADFCSFRQSLSCQVITFGFPCVAEHCRIDFLVSYNKQLLRIFPWLLSASDWMPYPSPIPHPKPHLNFHLYGSASLVFGEWCEAKVRLHNAEVGKKLLSQVV